MRTLRLLAVAVMLVPTLARAEDPPPLAYDTLAARRPEITLPAYTAAEKQQVADMAQIFLRDLYVNRERKISIYGPGVDPVPGVAAVVANAKTMSEATLHDRLEHLFTSQHDLHLNYYYPVPFSCYRSLLPFSVEQATDPAGHLVVAVKALAQPKEVWPLSPGAERIAVGDVLVSYDGVDPLEAAKALADVGAGANEFGSIRRGLENLTLRSQKLHALPANDMVRLAFRSRVGEDYALDLPWLSSADPVCLGVKPPAGTQARNAAAKNTGSDEYQIEFDRLFKPHARHTDSELEARKDTDEPILHYDVLQNEYGVYGYLRLDSFVPEKLTPDEVIAAVTKLLRGELATTDGLIIDVRGNGGGDIGLAERMAQLFTPATIEPEGFRLLNTDVNRFFFDAAPTWAPPFREALRIAKITGARYTEPLDLTTPEAANNLGQAYFKPVALLTNASCYSACDMFSATLQDHGIATVWGEDGRTGGGGANVVDLQDFFLANLPAGQTGPFAPLPAKQNMRVAWRQTVRVGKSAGQLIEEFGVSADKLAVPSVADFFTDDSVQLRLLASDLNRASLSRQSWYRLAAPQRKDLPENAPLVFGLTAAKTEAIEIRRDGRSLGYQEVTAPASTHGTDIEIRPADTQDLPPLGSFELFGYSAGERVWRAVQAFRRVPPPTPLAQGARIAPDLAAGQIAPFVVYTTGADPAEGWSPQNGKLKAGLGDHYPDYLHTEASLFLDLTQRQAATLRFDVEGKTEEGYDFFSAAVFVDGVRTDLLAPASGAIALSHHDYDLTPYAGKTVELRFVFDSDGGVNDKGVAISGLVVE